MVCNNWCLYTFWCWNYSSYATWSILLLQKGKRIHLLWVSPMTQAHTFPHWLWGQFLMEFNHLILISEADGPVRRLWGKDVAPRIMRGRLVWWWRHGHMCLLRIPVLGKWVPLTEKHLGGMSQRLDGGSCRGTRWFHHILFLLLI